MVGSLPAVQAVESEVVGQVPDGCLGGRDGLPLGQARYACLRGHLSDAHLRVAAVGDPGNLGPHLRFLRELVVTWEG